MHTADYEIQAPANVALFNIAQTCSDRWAQDDPQRLAMIQNTLDGLKLRHSTRYLQHHANRLAPASRFSVVQVVDAA